MDSDGGEIVGDIAQGALIARAVEPDHGRADGPAHGSACLNCGTALLGSHCHACGQAAHVHRTLGAFFHDLLHGVFHFEGKIWRTLPLLAWNPGRLTREYIDGRRASYVSPIALFLFSVFLMFAVVKQVAGGLDPNEALQVDGDVPVAISQLEGTLREQETTRAELVRQGRSTAALDEELAKNRQALELLRGIKDGTPPEFENASDIPALDQAIKAMRDNPGLVTFQLQTNAYKYSWALIPISVPFVWLLFPFSRRFYLYDHTVFVTYSLSFMSLLAVVLTLANAAGAPLVVMAALLLPPWHMYRQLRGTYGLSRFGAIWRTWAMLFIATTVLMLFAMLILAQSGG